MEMRFPDRGPLPIEPEQFSILLVCDTRSEAETAARGIASLVQARGDVRICPVGFMDALVGVRVNLIIVGITHAMVFYHDTTYKSNPNMGSRWLREVLALRRHPQCGVIDIHGIMKEYW